MDTSEIDPGSRAGSGVVLGGGLAILAAALLPWTSVTTEMGTQTVVGTDTPDGTLVLITGGMIAAMGLARLVRKHQPPWAQIFPALGALGVGYLGWWHIQYAQNAFAHYSAQYPQLVGVDTRTSVGGGLYLIVIGAVAALIGASTQARVDLQPGGRPIAYYLGMWEFDSGQ